MKFLVVEGTVREGRKSIHVARHVTEVLDEKEEAELYDLKEKEVPLMKTRTYSDPGEPPEDVQEFSKKVEEADGLILVSPEYNHSIPGALKNLLDYLYPEYEDKPFSYVTVSAGGFGGVRCVSHLHDITFGLGGVPGPDMQVSRVGNVFDKEGKLSDEDYKERFEDFADDVIEHVKG